MCLALLVTNIARAEGSIQLNPNDDGKRTYLEYKSGASFGVVGTSTLYVVARAGETITLAGSILNSYDGNDIVVTSVKDGRVWSFDVTESIGFIANRAAEKAGPYYPASGTRGNRYMPLTFTVPFDGVYSVVFHTMNGWNVIPADYNPADQRCDDYWEQSYYHNADHSQGDGIAAWDISVFDTADNLQTGRVFASYLVISDGDIGTINGADGIYAKLYLLTHDGYLYRINTNGFDPDGMTFYADNVGMIDNGSNQTLYKHTNNQNVIGGDVSIVYPNCDMEYDRMTHRIFFNEPDNSITDILNIATTPQGYADITCDKITFSGNRIASDNSGIANEGMGGVFKVSFSKACTYELIIDTNKDGNFDGSDLVMMDAASAGDNIMLWNGKDANGNKLPSGTYEVRVKVHAGELHLPMSDLEDNVNGYELYLANTLASGSSSFSDERQYRIWYDGSDYETFNGTQVLMHSDVSGSLIGNGATTVYEPNPYKVSYDETLSSKIGSDGKGGFLFYSQSSAYNRGYGNNRILDVWTYSTSADALYGTFTISDDSDAYAYVTGTAYFDKDGDLKIATDIVFNAKTRRVSVCNALDCLIIHKERLSDLPQLAKPLCEKGVGIYADSDAYAMLKDVYKPDLLHRASADDFGREFLSLNMAIKTVSTLDEALNHIYTYGLKHSEAIVTDNEATAQRFVNEVDAACVYVNASTAFTDGAQFGLGAEIGISTQKLHARGPMALKELTSYKWQIFGNGQTRS